MELAGTGQMWAGPGDSRQHPLPPAIPALLSPATEQRGSGMAAGLCTEMCRGGEGEHPQVRSGGGWWDIWAPFFGRDRVAGGQGLSEPTGV